MLPTIGVNQVPVPQSGKTAPVLMLTAKDTIWIKSLVWMLVTITGKPVDVVELLARVRALDGAHPCGKEIR